MKDTPMQLNLQSKPFRPIAYLKGAKNYAIPLTQDEEIRLMDLHESRTVILNALMNIDAQQNEIRNDIKKRTGLEGIILFRNNNIY